jgi:hypothetical protein
LEAKETMQRKKATSEAAPIIGLAHQVLLNYLNRYPDLKPADKLPNGDYLWSEEDIQSVIDFRARRRRPGKTQRAKRLASTQGRADALRGAGLVDSGKMGTIGHDDLVKLIAESQAHAAAVGN